MKKEIEEMANLICNYVKSRELDMVYILQNVCHELLPTTHNAGIAEALYNAGYRRVFDENNRIIIPELWNFETLVRIQAIKEFAEKLINDMCQPYSDDTYSAGHIERITKELAKQYGVEIDKEEQK